MLTIYSNSCRNSEVVLLRHVSKLAPAATTTAMEVVAARTRSRGNAVPRALRLPGVLATRSATTTVLPAVRRLGLATVALVSRTPATTMATMVAVLVAALEVMAMEALLLQERLRRRGNSSKHRKQWPMEATLATAAMVLRQAWVLFRRLLPADLELLAWLVA